MPLPSLQQRTSDSTDPGAVDNRLSLDPNDARWKDMLAEWEDGQEYTVTLTITQLSPGEFEVSRVSGEGESPAEEATPKEEPEPTPMKGRGMMSRVSKPVRDMMAGE